MSFFNKGKDIEHSIGGTWLGVNKQGRFSVLTNWRKPVNQPLLVGARSRGLYIYICICDDACTIFSCNYIVTITGFVIFVSF